MIKFIRLIFLIISIFLLSSCKNKTIIDKGDKKTIKEDVERENLVNRAKKNSDLNKVKGEAKKKEGQGSSKDSMEIKLGKLPDNKNKSTDNSEKKSLSSMPSKDEETYIEIFKKDRLLKLYKDEKIIKEFKIGLGFNPIGHKEKEGDGKTPEGEYYISTKNPNSKYYLSLGLSYPNIKDAKRGLKNSQISQDQFEDIKNSINNKRTPNWYTNLGGEIMIHGHGNHEDWTEGCIALDDIDMDILWEYCNEGVKVSIKP